MMNKTKLITAILLVGTGFQNAVATETVIQTFDPVTGEVMLIPDGMCPNGPDCIPPIQELETEEDKADNG